MAYEETIIKVSAVAGVDLSAEANRYTGVKLNASGSVIKIAALTDNPFGVLQNDPRQGQAAAIAVSGISKVKAGAVIAPGDQFSFNTSGKAIIGAVGAKIVGTAVTGGVANDVISALINTASAPTK